MGDHETQGGNLYDGTQPNYGGNDKIFGDSPYNEVDGGGLVASYNNVGVLDTWWGKWRILNVGLMVVSFIIIFVAVFFQNDAAQDAMQFATMVLIFSTASIEVFDQGESNPSGWAGDDKGKVGSVVLTAMGIAFGSWWAGSKE